MVRRLGLVIASLLTLAPLPSYAQTAVLTDSFDSGAVSAAWGQTLTTNALHYTPNTAETTFVNSPAHSGAKAAHYYTLIGTDERAPWQIGLDGAKMDALLGTNPTEFYFTWHEYFATGYDFPNSSQKLVRFGYANGSYPANKVEIGVLIQNSNADINVQFFCGLWGDSSLCNVDNSAHSDQPIALDTWVKFGLWAKMNTPGASDGFIKLYKDDVLFLDKPAVDIRGNGTKGFDYMWIGGNYSNGGNLSASGHRYIDDVALYRSKNGGRSVRGFWRRGRIRAFKWQ